jgi:hemerythrin-like domain-containing protein
MDHDALTKDHEEMDRHVAVLLTKADGGDCHELAAEWDRFEGALLHHFVVEEHELFPSFVLLDPEETMILQQEHEALRRDVLALGIDADLHCLHVEELRSFVADLRAHAAREERVLYRWAKDNVDADVWATIGKTLRGARDVVTHQLAELGGHTL